MASSHSDGKLSKKVTKQYPLVYVDQDSDFASIKIHPGVEARSYLKDGITICEDDLGNVIEIQILNLSLLKSKQNAS